MARNEGGWITPVRKERRGKFPFEKGAAITLQSLRGEMDWAHSSDCRSEGFTNFDIKPWSAMSSLDNWDEQAVSPDGLAYGENQKLYYPFGDDLEYYHPSIPWEERLVCDIFGNVMEMEFVSKSGHVNFHEIEIDFKFDEVEEVEKEFSEWMEQFSEKECECYYCIMAEEWVKKIEELMLKEEIKKQYKEVLLSQEFINGKEGDFSNNKDGIFREFDITNLKERIPKRRSRRKKKSACKWNNGRKNKTISDYRGDGVDINLVMQAKIKKSIAEDEEFRRTFVS